MEDKQNNTIDVQRHANGRWDIYLNRPKSYNGYIPALGIELRDVFRAAEEDSSCLFTTLRGHGSVFCVGGDMGFFSGLLENQADEREVLKVVLELADLIKAMLSMQKPIIGCVHGAVAGAGMALMLAADWIIAEKNTVFNPAYSQIGLTPDGGLSYLLSDVLGRHKALEWLIRSDKRDTAWAKENGLINIIATDDNIETELDSLHKYYISRSQLVNQGIKKCVNLGYIESFEAVVRTEAEEFVAAQRRIDFAEGINAFLSKRKPEFTN